MVDRKIQSIHCSEMIKTPNIPFTQSATLICIAAIIFPNLTIYIQMNDYIF